MHKDILTLTDQLLSILRQENTLLKNRKLAQACLLHPEKDRLNGEYQLAWLVCKSDSNYLKSLSQQSIAELQSKTELVKSALDENRELVSMISTSNRRIIHALIEKFSAPSMPIPTYSAFGSVKTIKPKAFTFTINRCV